MTDKALTLFEIQRQTHNDQMRGIGYTTINYGGICYVIEEKEKISQGRTM